jgi:hypothetical protein
MNASRISLTLWVLAVYVLHQDFWNWTKTSPLLFGLFPPGLAYHLAYSVVAAVTMAMLVRFAWPSDLDADERDETQSDSPPSS